MEFNSNVNEIVMKVELEFELSCLNCDCTIKLYTNVNEIVMKVELKLELSCLNCDCVQ